MFGIYALNDWYGGVHFMKASTIHQKVLEDSKKSNYNWIAPASNLIKVCDKKGFPKEYALDIKIAILNCYSYLMSNNYQNQEDMIIIYKIYNSLFKETDNKVTFARLSFINAFIMKIFLSSDEMFFLGGPNFTKVCRDWQKEKVKQLIKQENIDFDLLRITLEKEYINLVKDSRINGVFEEDAKIEAQRYEEYLKQLK